MSNGERDIFERMLDFDMMAFEARVMALQSLCQEHDDSHKSFAERYGNIMHKEPVHDSSRH